MGDHSETLQLDFDPTVVSYERLLQVFVSAHSPFSARGRQYRSAVLFHSEAQREAADKALAELQTKSGRQVATAVEPCGHFWPAEAYHQKFLLRNNSVVMSSFADMSLDEFVHSPAASRVNAFLGSTNPMSYEKLQKEIAGFKLTAKAKHALENAVRDRARW